MPGSKEEENLGPVRSSIPLGTQRRIPQLGPSPILQQTIPSLAEAQFSPVQGHPRCVHKTFHHLGSEQGCQGWEQGLSHRGWAGLFLTFPFEGLFSCCLKPWFVYPSGCNSAEVWVFYS